MANKRTLKKAINNIAGELFTECVIMKSFVPGTDEAKITDIMCKVLAMQDDLLRRVGHPEPGNVKASYKKLRADLFDRTNDIMEELGKLN